MTPQEKIATLARLVSTVLPEHRRSFAYSLLSQFGRKQGLPEQRLSDKQWYHVDKMIRECEPKPINGAQIVDLTRLIKLFETARANKLVWPAIRVETPKGRKLVLKPGNGKYAGTVQVNDAKRKVWNEKLQKELPLWYASIDANGEFTARNTDAETDVLSTLKEFAANPVKAASLHGQQHGNCCFCGIDLVTNESLTVGYGPICADKYGLPWGKVDRATIREWREEADVGNAEEAKLATDQLLDEEAPF